MSTENEPTYASAAAVAGLAREVEALRRAIESVQGIPAQVDDLARVVGDLADEVAARSARGRLVAPSWLGAPGEIDTVRRALEELTEWLREVYLRYPDARRGLPECWLWHPDVVEELLWLMYAWIAAYRDDTATVAAAGDWHDRYRPGVVRRISLATKTCALENHQPHHGHQPTGGPVVPVAAALEPIASWWAVRRTEAAPEPTDEHIELAAEQRHGGDR